MKTTMEPLLTVQLVGCLDAALAQFRICRSLVGFLNFKLGALVTVDNICVVLLLFSVWWLKTKKFVKNWDDTQRLPHEVAEQGLPSCPPPTRSKGSTVGRKVPPWDFGFRMKDKVSYIPTCAMTIKEIHMYCGWSIFSQFSCSFPHCTMLWPMPPPLGKTIITKLQLMIGMKKSAKKMFSSKNPLPLLAKTGQL